MAFDLHNFNKRFITCPGLRIVRVQYFAGITAGAEHFAVTAVRVVGDGQRVYALTALTVHPDPQIFRVARVSGGERQSGYLRIAEDYVSVQVGRCGARRGEFIAHEGGEMPRIVVSIGG